MSSLKTLCNEMEFIVQFPEVGLAISDSASPVPGYLYGEINALTYVDYGKNCKPLINFLISRLLPQTPLVSIKILKLLLHLVKNGHTEIIEEVKFHEVVLKEAMGFHGPPDDLHGKTFYESIRKNSKELLEYIFSENKEVLTELSPSRPELTGYGSTASAKGLPGFGFSIKKQKSVSEKINEGVTSLVEKLLPVNEQEQLEKQTSHIGDSLPQYKPLIINKDLPDKPISHTESYVISKPITSIRPKQKTRVYKPGKPGGGWDDSEDDEEEDQADLAKEDVSKSSLASFDCLELSKVEAKESIVDWIDEHKVVETFAVNESLYMIDYTSVSNLCKGCSSLNCEKILEFLLEKIEEKEELVQLRALVLIEYLIFHDIISLESLMKIIVPPLRNFIEKDENIPNSVRLKAKKVCLIVKNLSKTSPHPLPPQTPQKYDTSSKQVASEVG